MTRHEHTPQNDYRVLENDIETNRRTAVLALTTKYDLMDKDYDIVGTYTKEQQPWSEMKPLPHQIEESAGPSAARRLLGSAAVKTAWEYSKHTVKNTLGGDDDTYEESLRRKAENKDARQRQKILDLADKLERKADDKAQKAANKSQMKAHKQAKKHYRKQTLQDGWGQPDGRAQEQPERRDTPSVNTPEKIVEDIIAAEVPTLYQILDAQPIADSIKLHPDGKYRNDEGNVIDTKTAESLKEFADLGYWEYSQKDRDELQELLDTPDVDSLNSNDRGAYDEFSQTRPADEDPIETFAEFKATTANLYGRMERLSDEITAYQDWADHIAEQQAAAERERQRSFAEPVTTRDERELAARLRSIHADPNHRIAQPIAIHNELSAAKPQQLALEADQRDDDRLVSV